MHERFELVLDEKLILTVLIDARFLDKAATPAAEMHERFELGLDEKLILTVLIDGMQVS